MPRKRFSAEEIVNKLREADVLISQGQTIAQACKQIEITDQTYYRWRREYGGLKTDQAKRLKELERENGRLKQLVAELSLDKAMLQEVSRETTESAAEARSGAHATGLLRRLSTAGVQGAHPATRHAAVSAAGA